MKNFLSIVTLLISIHSFAQKNWIKENFLTYSIKHPSSWQLRQTEGADELDMAGPTPDFEGSNDHLGTSLFISSEPSKYSAIDLAAIAYKEKLLSTEFLKNTEIKKEEKIKFKGIDAIDITFTADLQHFSTACRIILFQHNNIYYELSVTYDQELSKQLLDEAHKVMESFEFSN